MQSLLFRSTPEGRHMKPRGSRHVFSLTGETDVLHVGTVVKANVAICVFVDSAVIWANVSVLIICR